MSITTEKALKAHVALQNLLKADTDNKFVFKTATRFKLAQNLRKLTPVQEDAEKERNSLIVRLGSTDENGNTIVKQENVAAFQNAIKELLEVAVNLEFTPIKVDDLGENQIPVDIMAGLIEFGILTE
jgi:uncharacterized protein YaaR (DUF327 family)